MADTESMSPLIARLRAMRRVVYRRLIIYGVCAVASGGVYALLTIIAMDWLLHLPPVPRIVIGLAFLAGFMIAAVYWVFRPVQHPVTMDEVAGRLERHFGNLQDRLSSTVSFIRSPDAGSPALMQRVMANTERAMADLNLEGALTLRPITVRVTLLAASGAILAAIWAVSPDWMRVGVVRYLDPFGRSEWPTRVAIEPLTGQLKAALGESISVRMRVSRGLTDTLRGVVHLKDQRGERVSVAMRRDGDQYTADIDAVTGDLEYWFEAGDASTQMQPAGILAIERPSVVEARAQVVPPAYAEGREPVDFHLGAEPIEAPIGGAVRLRIVSSKTMGAASPAAASGLRDPEGRFTPLAVDANDPTVLSGTLIVEKDLTFRIVVVDKDGFENRGAPLHTIIAVPDQPPTVAITHPASALELTPRARLDVDVRAEDDLGIRAVEAHATSSRGELSQVTVLKPVRMSLEASRQPTVAARMRWQLDETALEPGDAVTLTGVAWDNRPTDPEGGQMGRSTSVMIRIISAVDFENRARDELVALEAMIRQSALDESEILDRTEELVQPPEQAQPLAAEQRTAVGDLASRQSRLARRVVDIAARARRLRERMAVNRVHDLSAIERVDALDDALQSISSVSMSGAATALNDALEREGAAAEQRRLEHASRLEGEALTALRSLLRDVAKWSDFESLVTRTRDLLDRQSELRTATEHFGKSALGKPVESLTPTERETLELLNRRQEQLTQEVEQHLAQMRQQSESLRDTDEAGAGAVEQALREAAANELVRHLRAAGEALPPNRTAAAVIEQKSAEEAMQRMLAGLENRQSRELDELRKRVEEMEDAIANLLAEQRALLTATDEARQTAAPPAAYTPLAERQRAIRRNTRRVADDLAQALRTAEVAALVEQAAAPMAESEAALLEPAPETAWARQGEARALLEQALEMLRALNEELRDELMRRSLAQIREGLEAMLAAQRQVTDGIIELKKSVDAAGLVGRLEARTASRLANDQNSVRAMIDVLAPQLEAVVVFDWAMQRVAAWMDTSAEWLSRRKIDAGLIDLSQRTVAELERLVQAIEATEGLATDSPFVSDMEGGGEGQPGEMLDQPPVPPVTELLVLKAMQLDLNQRTREFAQGYEPQEATEAQLRQLRELSEDQAQIRRLTERLTERARSGD